MDGAVNRMNLPIPMGRPLTGQDLLDLVNTLLPAAPGFAVTAMVSTTGTVTAVSAGPPPTVTLTAAGQTVVCRRAASYTPAVGDLAFVISNGQTVLALCAVA